MAYLANQVENCGYGEDPKPWRSCPPQSSFSSRPNVEEWLEPSSGKLRCGSAVEPLDRAGDLAATLNDFNITGMRRPGPAPGGTRDDNKRVPVTSLNGQNFRPSLRVIENPSVGRI